MEQQPRLLITMGDPAGIGPEVIAKACAEGGPALLRSVIVGDAAVMRKIVQDLRIPIEVRTAGSCGEAVAAEQRLNVLDLGLVDMASHRWGAPSAVCGSSVVAYLTKAVELIRDGQADALVTAPISKEMMNAAGHHFAGHTELLASLTNTKDYGMMFVGGGLRLILATIHVALKDVPTLITRDAVLRVLRLAQRAMPLFGVGSPRIGVCALNPHAGEGGLFGSEDRDEVLPAVIAARGEGIHASDPLPADTLFYKARNGHYDIVVAMYHDQGLAPLKMIAFGNAVNVTVGLPLIRTSVDHGTAYDIAGKGCANPASLAAAAALAADMVSCRARLRGEAA